MVNNNLNNIVKEKRYCKIVNTLKGYNVRIGNDVFEGVKDLSGLMRLYL